MAHLAHFLPLKNESVYVKRKSKDFGKSRAKNGPNGPRKSLTKLEKNLWEFVGIAGDLGVVSGCILVGLRPPVRPKNR